MQCGHNQSTDSLSIDCANIGQRRLFGRTSDLIRDNALEELYDVQTPNVIGHATSHSSAWNCCRCFASGRVRCIETAAPTSVNLTGSGRFDAVRAPSPIGQLDAPGNVRLLLTNMSGQLSLRYDKVANAANYSYQTATDDAGPWTEPTLWSNTRVTLDGLTPGKVYWARVRANGTTGPSEWSQPATAMAV
jgi:hypothetical protein